MSPIFNTIFKALAIALGTAVFVLSFMNVKMESNSLFMMLGLAVAFLSLSMMEQKDESKNKEDEN
jgi:hypothetical protein